MLVHSTFPNVFFHFSSQYLTLIQLHKAIASNSINVLYLWLSYNCSCIYMILFKAQVYTKSKLILTYVICITDSCNLSLAVANLHPFHFVFFFWSCSSHFPGMYIAIGNHINVGFHEGTSCCGSNPLIISMWKS